MENIEIKPTNQELVNSKEQRKLEIQALLSGSDYKVSRHIEEKALNLPSTLTEEDYLKLCKFRYDLRKEFNTLQKEVEALLILIDEESKQQMTN